MSPKINKLFYIWLILLPFGYQLSAYTAVIEPDKVMALILLLIGFVGLFRFPKYRQSRVIFFIFLAVSLSVLKSISLVGSEFYWGFIWDDLNKTAYFVVPLLFINSVDTFRRVGWLVVFIAIVGCVSTFLVSIGLVTLPISVPLEYRISWLPRAKGLFLSTGNLAQYIAFAVAWVIVAPGIADKKNKSLRLARWLLLISLAMGLVATQSRNIFIVLVISLFVLWLLKKTRSMTTNARALVVIVLVVGLFIPLFAGIGFYFTELADTVAGAGGKYAKTSVLSRFAQYNVAWDVIKMYPLFGADAEIYRRMGSTIEHIHNMWLQLLVSGGIISAIIMLTILTSLFKSVRNIANMQERSGDAIVVTVYFVAMVIAAMFYVGMDKMFWALLGIAAALTCIGPLSREINVSQKQQSLPQTVQESSRTGVRLRS